MLDAHQMNVFLRAAESRNFSEAARQLCMTQPSVSQHIRSLELRFGMTLFERKGRRLKLTEAGQALLPLAREMVRLSLHIEESLHTLHGEVHGDLLIGCCTSAGRFLLPKLLSRFLEKFPSVMVTCHITDQQTARNLLSEGKLHIMLAPPQESCSGLESRHFLTDPIQLVCNRRHRWAGRTEIEPQELLEENFVVREEASGTQRTLRQALPSVNLSGDQLKKVMVLGASESVALAVQEGIGVAFLTRLAAGPGILRGDLINIRVRGLALSQDIWLSRYINFPATRAQLAFWEFALDPTNMTFIERGSIPRQPTEGSASGSTEEQAA